MNAVQIVLTYLKNIKPSIKLYVLGLMLANSRKNCAAMSHATGISEKKFYHFFAEPTVNTDAFSTPKCNKG